MANDPLVLPTSKDAEVAGKDDDSLKVNCADSPGDLVAGAKKVGSRDYIA